MEHGFFVWPAFVITFLVLGFQLWEAFRQARHIRQKLRDGESVEIE